MSIATMGSNGYNGLTELPQVDLPYRSPSIRREPKISGNKLRNLYQSSNIPAQSHIQGDLGVTIDTATPILPPTPPHIEDGPQDDEPSSSDTAKIRSVLVTPVNQMSPPTPDITPPRNQRSRQFLGARPSMASTYAESFKTAQEDIPSDGESNISVQVSRKGPAHRPSPVIPTLHVNEHRPSPLGQALHYELEVIQPGFGEQNQHYSRSQDAQEAPAQTYEDSPVIPQDMFPRIGHVEAVPVATVKVEPEADSTTPLRRGLSLRERLEESQNLPRSRSLDKFANIIGWNEAVQAGDSKRWSSISTSTIGAIVVDQPQVSKKRGTLRHVSKNNSLRSVSSPLPPPSHPETPHKLNHKKGRLSNRNRQSFGSDHLRSFSLKSYVPAPKMEVIRVAVIPERVSSLQPSTTSTRRHSHSASTTSTPVRPLPSSDHGASLYSSDKFSAEVGDRGRNRYYPPQVGPFTVPPRSTSLSAPTSRTTSRANSLNSESIRSAQKQAEHDLRSTLNRMETDRLASSLQSLPMDTSVSKPFMPRIEAHDFATGVGSHPEYDQVPPIRSPSAIATLYSAPSFLSASPEINEAKIVSFFPHNNHSIQLIEPFSLQESGAVQLIRHQYIARARNDSPFRDPRAAPVPPLTSPHGPMASLDKRPLEAPARADSFVRTLMRTVSLKHARNRKADQDLDASSHPMWRPRPFWDDEDTQKEPAQDEKQPSREREMVQNSVGIPHTKNTIMGPVALMHRISNRRRNRKAIVKQASFTSLHRLRTGRKLYRIPGLGVHLQMMSVRDIQGRFNRSRLRKEEERREQRREELRKAIGSNVISTGDSRFHTDIV